MYNNFMFLYIFLLPHAIPLSSINAWNSDFCPHTQRSFLFQHDILFQHMPFTKKQYSIVIFIALVLSVIASIILYSSNPGCNGDKLNYSITPAPGSFLDIVVVPIIFLPLIYLISFFVITIIFWLLNNHKKEPSGETQKSAMVYGVFGGLLGFILVLAFAFGVMLMYSLTVTCGLFGAWDNTLNNNVVTTYCHSTAAKGGVSEVTLEQIKEVFIDGSKAAEKYLLVDDMEKRTMLKKLLSNANIKNKTVAQYQFKKIFQPLANCPKNPTLTELRRVRDSNSWWVAPHTLSKRAH